MSNDTIAHEPKAANPRKRWPLNLSTYDGIDVAVKLSRESLHGHVELPCEANQVVALLAAAAHSFVNERSGPAELVTFAEDTLSSLEEELYLIASVHDEVDPNFLRRAVLRVSYRVELARLVQAFLGAKNPPAFVKADEAAAVKEVA